MVDKKHVVDEIIRTAKENNGVPLGRREFASETGIKYSDWHKRFEGKRKRGEWFELSSSDVKVFTRRRTFM